MYIFYILYQVGKFVDPHVIRLITVHVADVVCDDVTNISGEHAASQASPTRCGTVFLQTRDVGHSIKN